MLQRITLQIALVIFAIEALIMLVLPTELAASSYLLTLLIDAGALAVATSPIIYFWIIKPYVKACHLAEIEAETVKKLGEVQALENRLMDDVINGLPGMFYLLDAGGRFVRWNRALEDISGYGAGELKNMSVLALFEGDDVPLIGMRIRDVLEAGHSSVEASIVTKAGQRLPYYLSGHRIVINNQPHVVGLGIDISERRLIAEALRKSERHFSTLVAVSPVGIFEADRDGRCIYVNHRWSEMTGLSQKAAADDGWMRALHPRDREAVLREWVASVAERRHFSLEYRFLLGDGGFNWVLGQSQAFYSEAGELQGYIGTITDINEKKKSEDVMWRQANFDLLTDLPNRLLFFDRLSKDLSQARRSNKRVALMYFDLDGFKPINDEYGHLAGDLVLKTVARRWGSCVREVDTFARMGGDEFAIILGELDSPAEAAAVAEKLLQTLGEEIQLPDGKSCTVGASVGISIFPDNGTEMDSLLAAADIAMYESKKNRRNIYTFFSPDLTPMEHGDWIMFDDSHRIGIPEMDEQHRELIQLVNRLNLALRNNEDDGVVVAKFQEMIKFTVHHFKTEECLMAHYRYPAQEAHAREHERLVSEVQRLVGQLHHGSELLILQAIKDWLLNHIRGDDKYLGAYLAQQEAAQTDVPPHPC